MGRWQLDASWCSPSRHKAYGSVEQSKSKLVAKGLTQTYGIYYDNTFAPVAKMNSIRLLSVVAKLDWALHQFDLKNAFFHGDIEEVYMEVPLDLKIHPLWVKCAN
jgi:hypothetical protein